MKLNNFTLMLIYISLFLLINYCIFLLITFIFFSKELKNKCLKNKYRYLNKMSSNMKYNSKYIL